MPDNISCRIEECTHNTGGGCDASSIEVRSSVKNKVCKTAENTCCESFQTKG